MPTSFALAGVQDRARSPRTILVVDDDELVREMMSRFLSLKGYHVIEAATADEAVSLLDANSVDVVLTDVRMPGHVDGIGLASWIRDRRPEIRVLIASGYASSAQQAVEVSNNPLILKPYQPEEVVRRVEALARRG